MTSLARPPLLSLCLVFPLSGIGMADERFGPVPRAGAAACAQATVYGIERIPVDPVTYPTVHVPSGEIQDTFPLGLVLKNTGGAALTDLSIEVTGESAAEFHAGDVSALTLAPGRKIPLPLELHPTSHGLKKATVRLGSNDCTRPVVEFNLHFMVAEGPDISRVSLYGDELGDTIVFGPTAGGDARDDFFYIRNAGSSPLEKLRMRLEGPNAADFVVSKWRKKSLGRGERERMDVSFRPTGPGERTATLVFGSDDFDEPEFRIELKGTATDEPRLKVLNQEQGIDFGTLAFGKTSKRSFLVANTGFSPLSLVLIDAPVHAGVTVVSPSSSFPLLPDESRKVTVMYTQMGLAQSGIIRASAYQDSLGGSFIGWSAALRTGRK